MYCIECGAPIEAAARLCGVCRFPQPLEEFADFEPGTAAADASKPVLPVRLVETPPKRNNRARLAAAIAVFVVLCLSTGLAVYLLTRKPANTPAASTAPASSTNEAAPNAEPAPADRVSTPSSPDPAPPQATAAPEANTTVPAAEAKHD